MQLPNRTLLSEAQIFSGEKLRRRTRGIGKQGWKSGRVKRKNKRCPVGKDGSEFNGFCCSGKKVGIGIDRVLRYFDLALNDGPWTWFGAVRTSKIRKAHSGEGQEECNQQRHQKRKTFLNHEVVNHFTNISITLSDTRYLYPVLCRKTRKLPESHVQLETPGFMRLPRAAIPFRKENAELFHSPEEGGLVDAQFPGCGQAAEAVSFQ